MSRLSRVTDSIVSKNEKLKLINETIDRQRLIIEELTEQNTDLKAKESHMLNQMNAELYAKKQYEDQIFQLRRELDDMKTKIMNSSKQLQELTEVSKECFVLMSLESDLMETHCDALNTAISIAQNGSLMSYEDLLSTLSMRNDLCRVTASSSRIELLKEQIRSVRTQRQKIDRSLS